MEKLFDEVGDISSQPDWGSASQAALGKLEYHVGSMVQLLHCLEQGSGDASMHPSDSAFKTSVLFFAQRLLQGCAVIDHSCQVQKDQCKKPANIACSANLHPLANSIGKTLRQCQADPITMTQMAHRISHFRKDPGFGLRVQHLQDMANLGLGVVRNHRGSPCFYRHSLSEGRQKLLSELRVPLERWPVPAMPSPADNESAVPLDVAGPHMNGGGIDEADYDELQLWVATVSNLVPEPQGYVAMLMLLESAWPLAVEHDAQDNTPMKTERPHMDGAGSEVGDYNLLRAMSPAAIEACLNTSPVFKHLTTCQHRHIKNFLRSEASGGSQNVNSICKFLPATFSTMEKLLVCMWRCDHYNLYQEFNSVVRTGVGNPSTERLSKFLQLLIQEHGHPMPHKTLWRATIVQCADLCKMCWREGWFAATTSETWVLERARQLQASIQGQDALCVIVLRFDESINAPCIRLGPMGTGASTVDEEEHLSLPNQIVQRLAVGIDEAEGIRTCQAKIEPPSQHFAPSSEPSGEHLFPAGGTDDVAWKTKRRRGC